MSSRSPPNKGGRVKGKLNIEYRTLNVECRSFLPSTFDIQGSIFDISPGQLGIPRRRLPPEWVQGLLDRQAQNLDLTCVDGPQAKRCRQDQVVVPWERPGRGFGHWVIA